MYSSHHHWARLNPEYDWKLRGSILAALGQTHAKDPFNSLAVCEHKCLDTLPGDV